MARVIYKFGGTSVGDTRRLYRAARRIAAAHRAGDEVVAVLSAQAQPAAASVSPRVEDGYICITKNI